MYLAICAIIKDEGKYLKEWLAYHMLQGVEHFYLYDNGSTDDTETILDPLIEKGIVTYYPFPGEAMQLKAYDDCLKKLKGLSADSRPRWLAFIDADEFISAPSLDATNVAEPVAKALRTFERFNAVVVHWMLYGSNELKQYDERLVLERFTKSAATVNPHIKTIVNPEFASVYRDPHAFFVIGETVNEYGKVVPTGVPLFFEKPTADILRMNHFICKSEEEARVRWMRKRADNGQPREFETHFKAHDVNETPNYDLTIHLGLTKAKIAEIWGEPFVLKNIVKPVITSIDVPGFKFINQGSSNTIQITGDMTTPQAGLVGVISEKKKRGRPNKKAKTIEEKQKELDQLL